MNDLISRQAVIDAVKAFLRNDDEWFQEAAASEIRKLPSAVKRGKWIFENRTWFHQPLLKCSCCGRRQFVARFDYCPNCGAQMEDYEEGEE